MAIYFYFTFKINLPASCFIIKLHHLGGIQLHDYFAGLLTEAVNSETKDIDLCSTKDMLALINREDMRVPLAVEKEIGHIAEAVDLLHDSLSKGGRMFYLGAGTSGRLGILDASECPPTFNTEPELVQAYIAGGDSAFRTAVEGCEDSRSQGVETVTVAGVRRGDVVIGITASGSAPFVLAAVKKAKELGASTIGVVTNANSDLSRICDICIAPLVGPEVITGSTRMKSGTAQKLVLNMLSTCTMIKLGKVYGNLMVDLRPNNQKLFARAYRIIRMVCGVSEEEASRVLKEAGNNTKLAIMMLKTGLDANRAQKVLDENGGILRQAIAKMALKMS